MPSRASLKAPIHEDLILYIQYCTSYIQPFMEPQTGTIVNASYIIYSIKKHYTEVLCVHILQEDGEFVINPTVRVEDDCLEMDPKLESRRWDRDFVERHTRKNWEYPWQLKLC